MTKILDFVSKRKEKVEHKRREFERLMFDNFMGSYSVLDDAGSIYKIEMVDISETGCLFQIPWDVSKDKKYKEGDDIGLRMYFTQKSYIPVISKVKYCKEYVNDDGQTYIQYGCEFDESTSSYEALAAFVSFLYKFADYAVEDKGDSNQVFFL